LSTQSDPKAMQENFVDFVTEQENDQLFNSQCSLRVLIKPIKSVL